MTSTSSLSCANYGVMVIELRLTPSCLAPVTAVGCCSIQNMGGCRNLKLDTHQGEIKEFPVSSAVNCARSGVIWVDTWESSRKKRVITGRVVLLCPQTGLLPKIHRIWLLPPRNRECTQHCRLMHTQLTAYPTCCTLLHTPAPKTLDMTAFCIPNTAHARSRPLYFLWRKNTVSFDNL